MQNKYELIVENEGSKRHNYFYWLLVCLFLSLLFALIFLYNFAISMKISPILIQLENSSNSAELLEMGEGKDNKMTRKMEKELMEFYYSLKNVANKENKIEEQMVRLMAISRELAEGNAEWHKNALLKLGEKIQQKLAKLQNPPNCRQARLLIVKWKKLECGICCIFHFISFSLVIAAASNRVLIFENDAKELVGENGWNAIFEPITKCKYSESIGANMTAAQFPQYSTPNQTDRIVWMLSRWEFGGFREIEHMPPIVPNEFLDFLQKHHPNPPAWFLGQFIHFLWKPNSSILMGAKMAEKAIQFEKAHIVGFHVRRTDKNSEAGYHELDEYIKWAEYWFRVEQRRIELAEGEKGRMKVKRRLFIATDEPRVILDARQRFGGNGTDGDGRFEINAFDQNSQLAEKLANRFTTAAIEGIVAEIEMLIRCDFVVCTFSSNVCRLVFELMQALDGSSGNRVQSLDAFYDDWFYDHHMEAIEDYLVPESGEIDAQKGDIFAISQALWNGFVAGKNLRTGKSGHFPTFLLKDHLKNATFPIFSEFILN